ncbi:MAG: hypothetical protein ACO1PN_16205 [Betaproteobacteria bacterium]
MSCARFLGRLILKISIKSNTYEYPRDEKSFLISALTVILRGLVFLLFALVTIGRNNKSA